MTGYNYDGFSTGDYEFDRVVGPGVGERAPDFPVTRANGTPQSLLDYAGDFLVLEMGSITCPLFQSRRSIMEGFVGRDRVSGAVLYVREAHPGADIQSHKNIEAKLKCATRLISEDHETRTVLVDDLQGTVHKAYGSMPNAVFIINRNGCVVFRSDWNNPSATMAAVDALLEGRAITAKSYFRPASPRAVYRTFTNAGPGSASDFFKGLPVLIWKNLICRNLRLLFNRTKSGHDQTTC
ncbi:MAG: deiodinase-like protein [Pseudoruegeria sp.]